MPSTAPPGLHAAAISETPPAAAVTGCPTTTDPEYVLAAIACGAAPNTKMPAATRLQPTKRATAVMVPPPSRIAAKGYPWWFPTGEVKDWLGLQQRPDRAG